MKLFCKEKLHWGVKNGKLYLIAPNKERRDELLMRVRAHIEAEVREQIYNEICDLDLVTNRKWLVKHGIENVAKKVQDVCAQIALGNKK
jgi:uncharacterized protein YlzI (FlbEa/FlbD family)